MSAAPRLDELASLPDSALLSGVWAALGLQGAPDDRLESRLRVGLALADRRDVLVLRIWAGAKTAGLSPTPVRLEGARVARLASFGQHLPYGLHALAWVLQCWDSLSGARLERQALALKAALAAQEERSAALSLQLQRVEQRLQEGLEALARTDRSLEERAESLNRRIATQEDDLNRRVDLMVFEAREAVEAAALAIDDKRQLVDRLSAGAGRPG